MCASSETRARHDCHDAGQGEVARAAHHFCEAPTGTVWRNLDLRHDLVRGQRGGQKPEKKLRCWNRPLAAQPLEDDVRVERGQRGRELGGRIRVREAAAQRAAVTDGWMAHVTGRLGEERSLLLHEGGVRQRGVSHEGTDREATGRNRHDPVEASHAVEVDKYRGAHEPQIQHRHQALPTRENLDVMIVAGEQPHRLGEGLGPGVPKRGRLQEESSRGAKLC